MGTFGIDVDMGLLKGGSPDDIDSCRTSFDTIAMTGESLMRRLFEFCFLHFFSWPAPFEPGGHPGEPWPEAAYWSLSWDHISWESGQTAAEILIAFKAGVDIFFFWIFSLCFLQRVNSKSKKTLNIPLPLAIEGLLTELIRCEFFLFLGFLLHSHASTKITKNSLLITEHVRNIFSVIFDIWSSSIFLVIK